MGCESCSAGTVSSAKLECDCASVAWIRGSSGEREGGCLFEMVWREKGMKGTVRQRNSSAHPAAPGDTMSMQGRTGMKSWP